MAVKEHRRNTMRKTCADFFPALLKIAIRLGLMTIANAGSSAVRPLDNQIAMRTAHARPHMFVCCAPAAFTSRPR
jgi:hypothetical protein